MSRERAAIARLNEKLKGVSSVFFNLGAGTIAAAAARALSTGGVDYVAAL